MAWPCCIISAINAATYFFWSWNCIRFPRGEVMKYIYRLHISETNTDMNVLSKTCTHFNLTCTSSPCVLWHAGIPESLQPSPFSADLVSEVSQLPARETTTPPIFSTCTRFNKWLQLVVQLLLGSSDQRYFSITVILELLLIF